MTFETSSKEPERQLKTGLMPDLIAGFVVFLVALPLSLGIAMASGVPPLAGLFAAIAGGVIVSLLGGGHVGINGPAAGLIVVVLHGVEILGKGDPMLGYRGLLAAVVIAGGILVLLGWGLKAGKLGDIFPASAVHGMLAAIGVIILSKQVHVLLGVKPEAKTPLGLLAEIPKSLMHLNPQITLIGGLSLLIMIGFPLLKWDWAKKIPTPMIVVILGILLEHYFDLEHDHTYLFLPSHSYSIGPQFLVSLPQDIFQGIVNPDFQAVFREGFLGVLLTLVVVQGLETMLSASAVDKFDPLKRKTNLNRDLGAVGLASMVSGFIGGLPIITEIVRSRANVTNGARTSKANLFHGLFVLFFAAVFPGLLHQIPLACLAAVLILTGFRLAHPSQVKHALEIGKDQAIIFVGTLVVTVATDLLIGVLSGVAIKMALHLMRGLSLRQVLSPSYVFHEDGKKARLEIRGHAVFSNFLKIKEQMERLKVFELKQIDVRGTRFIDHTVMEKIIAFVDEERARGSQIEILGLDVLKSVGEHILSARHNGETGE